MSAEQFSVKWTDAGREPTCAPNPDFPDGIDLGYMQDVEPSCKVMLPYPAKRCGFYIVHCRLCDVLVALTTAGRPDDPRSVTMACSLQSETPSA